ncbi:hypothetical protein BHE74_00020910, partial [Ensete ventricosum]
ACDCYCNGWSRGGRKRGLLLLLARAAAAVIAGGEEWLVAMTGEESRATARDRRHNDARAKDRKGEEEVTAKDRKGEEVAVTQWRKAISSDGCYLSQQRRKIALGQSA